MPAIVQALIFLTLRGVKVDPLLFLQCIIAMTFGCVAALIALVAGLAGYMPARRASRIDPVLALRSE